MFIIGFPRKIYSNFLIISSALILFIPLGRMRSKYTLKRWFHISRKTDYLIPYSIKVFLITYSPFTFICMVASDQSSINVFFNNVSIIYLYMHGCFRSVLDQRFFNNVFTTYLLYDFCLRKTVHDCPQPTFFNDVFTTYLFIRRPSCTGIKDKL